MVQRFPCFSRLTEAEADTVSRNMGCQQLPPGETLFRQGDPGDVVYFLLNGQLEVTLELPDGTTRLLATLSSGSILGEMGFLLTEARAATAIAKTSVDLAHLDHATFQGAMDRGDSWASRFLLATAQTLAQRLGAANHELGALIATTRQSPAKPGAKKLEADLEALRVKLSSEWYF